MSGSAPQLSILVVWDKRPYEITVAGDMTIGQLKGELHQLTGVLPTRQKLLFAKKTLKDDQETLVNAKLVSGAKIMLVGSKVRLSWD